jgi:hypothetical protein
MMTQRTTTKTTKATEEPYNYKKILNIGYVLVCSFLVYKLGVVLYDKKTISDANIKNSSCPALLSISRSARDTLIVMKAEPLCDSYVLENIK